MLTRFGYIPVVSRLHDAAAIEPLIEKYSWALEKLGGKVLTEHDIDTALPLLYFVVTGGTEQTVLALRERRRFVRPDERVMMIAHSGHNSLPAAMEVLARIRQMGADGGILYVKDPDDDYGMETINRTLRDHEVRYQLAEVRIGRIGTPSEWLVASTPDPDTVKTAWGPTVIDIPMDELYSTAERFDAGAVHSAAREFGSLADGCDEPTERDLEESARVYLALSSLTETYGLQALTVRCFDLVNDHAATGCLALSRLNDEGVIAGCEGDVVSTLGMIWVYQLLGRVSWMANPARLNPEDNSLWLAHCTVPSTLVRRHRLRSHFESGLGAAVEGAMPRGPVTVFRIGGYNLERLWIGQGSIVETGTAANLCRTQVKVRFDDSASVGSLLEDPLGNHLILLPGHHRERLSGWWASVKPGKTP